MLERSKRKIETGLIVIVITIITMGSTAAAPLEISIEEKLNTTATAQSYEVSGLTFTYQTNVTGYINITNTGNDWIYDIWVAVELVNSTQCTLYYNNSTTEVLVTNDVSLVPDKINKSGVFNTTGANCFIHIPLLKPGGIVSAFYDVDDSSMSIANGAPFNVSEIYNPPKIPARGNYTWKVYFNVSLNTTWFANTALDLNGNTVTLNVTKYLSNNTTHFGSDKWVTLGPIANQNNESGSQPQSVSYGNSPYANNTPNTKLILESIQLNTSTSNYCNVSFDVTGNYTNTTAASYYFEPFGFAVFEFNTTFGNISGTRVVDVFAVGNASLNVTKYGPNATNYWFGNASIKNTASGLTYILTNVTMWATPQNDFSNVIAGPQEWGPNEELAPGESWNTSQGSPEGISFQYNQVPIIWANATFKLIQSPTNGWGTNNTTLHDFNATYGSNFIVIEKIYIIGTYLVKVTKHVMANTTPNVFDIYLVVENIGGNESPYVYVYDLIPQNFTEYNWNDSWTDVGDGNWVNNSSMFAGNGTQNIAPPLYGVYNKGHYWRLNPIAPNADGDGSYEDWDEIDENKTVVIFYQLNGVGDFRVLDVFIVGIDPMYSLNEQTSPKITVVSGAKATSYENLAALVAAAAFVSAFIRRR